MKSLHEHIIEKLVINKNYKGIDVDELVEKECKNLFWNMSLESDNMPITHLLLTIKYYLAVPVKIDPRYAEKCLRDLKMYNKRCNGMYIPKKNYTYVNGIDTGILEKYNRTQDDVDDRSMEEYDIYYLMTDKYFIFRIVTKSTNTTMDFISEL